jgi:hypothetical protein
LPLEVRLRNSFSWSFKSDFDRETVTVPPNSVEFVYLDLSARKNPVKEDYHPIKINADIRYLEDDQKAGIAIPFSYFVGPEKKYELSHPQQAIRVDGDLSEWSDLPYALNTDAEAPEDISGQFQIHYDEDWLYFAASIQDDDLQLDTAEVAWQQDFVGVALNADPLSRSAMRTGEGWYRESLLYILTPATEDLSSTTEYGEQMPEESRWKCRATEGGYRLEAAIPISYLEERQGENWQTLRLNFIVQDRDTGEQDPKRFTWMPDWRGTENRVGSGMFFRKP